MSKISNFHLNISADIPKAKFKGNISNFEDVNLSKDGTYKVNISGEMNIHGVTQKVETQGLMEVKDGKIIGNCSFTLMVADYDINIPAVVRDKIAKEMTIKVNMNYSEYKK